MTARRSPDIRAVVTLNRSAVSGYRPAHRITPEYFTTGAHKYLESDSASAGIPAEAEITFITPDAYPASVAPGDDLGIFEGSVQMGSAVVLRVMNPTLRRAAADVNREARRVLEVALPDGTPVAVAIASEASPFVVDGGGHVIGDFVPRPGFEQVRPRLDQFLSTYATGSAEAASAAHEAVDSLGLVAMDLLGATYMLSNVVFNRGGLLFNAHPTD
jgi:hypothetical protein